MTNHVSKVLGLTLALAMFAPQAFAQAQFQNASLKSRTAQRESDLRNGGTEGTLQDLFDHILNPQEIDEAVAAENARLERVKNAATYEEFLQVATPAEIAADLDDATVADLNDDDSMDNLISPIGTSSLVTITVNLGSQTMSMTAPNGVSVSDRVASGRNGYRTERIARAACYHPRSVERMHYSKKYKAPMPLSVFITGGYALHVGSLGIRSHGCVHLSTSTASAVFNAVKQYGARNTCIYIRR